MDDSLIVCKALTVYLMDEWETIPNEILTSLVDSMPLRRIEVIESKGNKTNYSVTDNILPDFILDYWIEKR